MVLKPVLWVGVSGGGVKEGYLSLELMPGGFATTSDTRLSAQCNRLKNGAARVLEVLGDASALILREMRGVLDARVSSCRVIPNNRLTTRRAVVGTILGVRVVLRVVLVSSICLADFSGPIRRRAGTVGRGRV